MISIFENSVLLLISSGFTWSIAPYVCAALAALALLIQFVKPNANYAFAAVGAFLVCAAILISANGSYWSESIVEYINAKQRGTLSRPPIPLIEPIFFEVLGESGARTLFGELIVTFILTYLILVGVDIVRSTESVAKDRVKGQKRPLIEVIKDMLASRKVKRPKRSIHNELGSGDLATNEQIGLWTKFSGAGDTALQVNGLRGSEGIALREGTLVIPQEQRNRHVLIVAKTGSGKTTRMIIPILYNDCMCPARTTIVIDSKPEMWNKLAGMTNKYNPDKQILLFNPLDKMRSLSWNILSKIEDDTDCKLIANTIIMATDVPGAKSDSPFFRNNALAILNAVMVGLLADKDDVLSMPRIHELVQSGIKPLCAWLEAHPTALRTSRTFIELSRAGSQNADTIMSELSMRLAAWDLSAIRATTSESEIDLETLISRPTLFIIELRESELEMLRPMANVIVVEILRFLTKRAEQTPTLSLPRPVSLVIDEFASALGRLPDIHVKLNTLRSRNVSICAAIQSTAQVKANYSDDADSVLAGFSTKIFMPALDLVDSEWASKESGQMTIRFKTSSSGSSKKLSEFLPNNNTGLQEQVQQRPVLTPDEIGRPVDNIATFFMPNTPVFQGFLKPHFKNAEMLKRVKESESLSTTFSLRTKPIEYTEKEPTVLEASPAAGAAPANITNTKSWTEEQLRTKLDELKTQNLDWENTTGSAKKWWDAFETENKHRLALVFRLAEELKNRKATITEFFLAFVYSNTDNIQANLHYLDYTRLKKEEERRKREAASKPAAGSPVAQAA
jgi:type IV secretion system protein VirD4